jgi:NADH:ubiquinone oxidoreductase subunit 6 (subunit J)
MVLARTVWLAPWPETASAGAEAVALPQLGHELVTTLVLPFEVISLVLLVAILGAILISRDTTS